MVAQSLDDCEEFFCSLFAGAKRHICPLLCCVFNQKKSDLACAQWLFEESTENMLLHAKYIFNIAKCS